jgi:hypothetical protein
MMKTGTARKVALISTISGAVPYLKGSYKVRTCPGQKVVELSGLQAHHSIHTCARSRQTSVPVSEVKRERRSAVHLSTNLWIVSFSWSLVNVGTTSLLWKPLTSQSRHKILLEVPLFPPAPSSSPLKLGIFSASDSSTRRKLWIVSRLVPQEHSYLRLKLSKIKIACFSSPGVKSGAGRVQGGRHDGRLGGVRHFNWGRPRAGLGAESHPGARRRQGGPLHDQRAGCHQVPGA